MLLREILQVKGNEVHTTVAAASVERVVQLMVQRNCGSLVVCRDDDAGQMVGIITERDILRALAAGKSTLAQLQVADLMTENVITGHTDSPVEEIMGLMTEKRIRHLPVVELGCLVGIISIGDIVKAQHDELTAENYYLKNYIQG